MKRVLDFEEVIQTLQEQEEAFDTICGTRPVFYHCYNSYSNKGRFDKGVIQTHTDGNFQFKDRVEIAHKE